MLWPRVPLGQLLEVPLEYGANTSALPFDPTFPRFVRITDIADDGVLRTDDPRSISHNSAAPYLLQPGDIVFARSGATVGKTYIHRGDTQAAFAGYLIRARVDADRLNPEFLFQFTQSPEYRTWVRSMFRAGAQPNINAEEYATLAVPSPPRVEQDRIVDIVRTWDRGISILGRLHAANLRALEGAGRQVLQLGDRDGHRGWGNGTLSDVVAFITSGVSVNAEDRPRVDGEIGVLKTTSVLTGIFDHRQHKAVVPAEVARGPRRSPATPCW